MSKRLKLENIKVQSFVTALDQDELKNPKGGIVSDVDCTVYPCTADPTCVSDSCPVTVPKFICTYNCGLTWEIGCTD